MSRPYGDECYVCPSCKGGTSVIDPHCKILFGYNTFSGSTNYTTVSKYQQYMDVCKCDVCGCVFAVDDGTIPSADY